MWILPTSIYSRFAAVPANSTSDCHGPSPAGESKPAMWLTVSGKPRLVPHSDRVWRSRPWSQLLFGAAIFNSSRQLTFMGWWTALLQDSPASHSAERGCSLDARMNATSSPASLISGTQLELAFYSSKTSPGSKRNSTTSPKSYFKGGGIRNGALFARPMLEPLTDGNDGFAWPTVNTSPDAPNGGLNRGGGCLRKRMTDQCLGRRAENFWPTASARDHKDTSGMAVEAVNPDGSQRNRLDQLPRAAVNWATPRVTTNGGAPTEHTGRGCRIEDQACNWQTITAQDADSRTSQKQRNGSITLALSGEALQWASPRSNCHTGADFCQREGSPTIQTQASHFSPPAPMIPGGPVYSADAPGLPPLSLYRKWLCARLGVEFSEDLAWRLNPAFTCWLMGWSPLWTSLIPILPPVRTNSESPETACAPSKLNGLSINC